ncbi:CopG family transcriptional regulator [Gluconobacter sp. LMG 31484]|uniref:CopG family transcriptional regulator n=1 Tax=Gluconobacter vitians TaxID=2728102 RepID=A0ABR9Y9H0_9PROT|nr:CopG family transcriptional regulator [Gluconobacter vitians]
MQHDDEETAAFLAAVQEGIADADAGRTVPYAAVREWLLSWGTEHEKPAPHCK